MLEVMDGCFSQFDQPDEVIPIVQVGPVSVAEMWHGPTGAFKDIALSIVGRLANHFLRKQGRKATVLVGTSGDTGSAAIHSVLGSENINIIVLYPRGRISRVQELQMTTVKAPNVCVYSVDGTSDDLDIPIKKLFADTEFVQKHRLISLNSVNVGRVLFQAVHFIYVYLKVCPEADHEVLFSIPSGGLGDLAGGFIAHTMGAPIKFLSAVNENDIVHRAFSTGIFSMADNVLLTPSSAMDIQIPYNIERVFYYLSGQSSNVVKVVMDAFEKDNTCVLPSDILDNNKCLTTSRVSMDETITTMQHVHKTYSYLVCPHTAVGMAAALEVVKRRSKTQEDPKTVHSHDQEIVVMATATPAKFVEIVKSAGLPVPHLERIERLHHLPESKLYMEKGEDWQRMLREAIEQL